MAETKIIIDQFVITELGLNVPGFISEDYDVFIMLRAGKYYSLTQFLNDEELMRFGTNFISERVRLFEEIQNKYKNGKQ